MMRAAGFKGVQACWPKGRSKGNTKPFHSADVLEQKAIFL
jgi:hypothetical protein